MDRLRSSPIRRRTLVQRLGLVGAGVLAVPLAACGAPAPTAPTKSAPAAASTPAGSAAAAGSAPVATPAGQPAATQAPPKPRTLQKARLGIIKGNAEYALEMMGAEHGIYQEEGIEPEFIELNDGASQLKGLLAGELDFGNFGPSALYPAQEGGAELRIVANAYPGLNFVFYARPGISSLKELESKSVGAAATGSFAHVIASTLLREKGVDLSKVTFVNVGSSPAVFQAVAAGKVDGGPSSIDFIPRATADGNPVIIAEFTRELPLYIKTAIIGREQDIRDRPQFVQSVVNAIVRSHRFGLDNKEAFVRYGVERMAKEQEQMEFLHDYDYQNRVVAADGELDPQKDEYTQQLNIEGGTQQAILPFERTTASQFQEAFVRQYGTYAWR